MKPKYSVLCVLAVVCLVAVFGAHHAMAAGPEEQVFSIIERVLDMVAQFMERIFQSLADAIRSIWSPADK